MPLPTTFARIAGFVATEADLAVILRRGPSAYVQMLVWYLATDEVDGRGLGFAFSSGGRAAGGPGG